MANYSLDLEILNARQKEFPGPNIAQIYVKKCSNDKGRIYITPRCVTLLEIDYQCDRLIKEIETIRKIAKKKIGE